MNLKEKFKKRTENAYNYPIKSGELLGDIIILTMGSFLAGVILMTAITIKSEYMFIGIALSIIIMLTSLHNTYHWIYRTVRQYENTYGSSTLGNKEK